MSNINNPDYPLHLLYNLLDVVKGRAFLESDTSNIEFVQKVLRMYTHVEYLNCAKLITLRGLGTLDITTEQLMQKHKVVKSPHMVKGFDRLIVSKLTGVSLTGEQQKILAQLMVATDLLKVASESHWYSVLYRILFIIVEGYPQRLNIADTYRTLASYCESTKFTHS